MITVHFEDRDWEFEDDKVQLKQAMVFHQEYGLTLRAWQDGVKDLDPRSIACSYWLMLQQNGVVRPLRDVDFDTLAFMMAYVEGMQAEAERKKAEEAEPDPTPDGSLPDTKTLPPQGSSTRTSKGSAASTSSSSQSSAGSEPVT